MKQHLEWCDHFALVFLFSNHPLVVDELRRRLASIYRARVTELQVLAPDEPEQLLSDVLLRLLDPPSYQRALEAPYWLDSSRRRGDQWRRARLDLLVRLNEQRERLRSGLGRPLVLVLPTAEREAVKRLVPDLWAIRDLSLTTGDWVEMAAPIPPVEVREPVGRFPLSDYESALVREWERVRGGRERGVLLAGGRAFDALLGKGHLEEAGSVSAGLLGLARERARESGGAPEALRDLSLSLDRVGDVALALGKLEEARAAYQEALELRRRVLSQWREVPGALRDLSVSLNKVGDVALALGELEEARGAYQEGLELRRRALSLWGETPDALRDLSVSLERVGAVGQALNEPEQARKAYREGLEIAEHLAVAFPSQPNYASLSEILRERLAALEP